MTVVLYDRQTKALDDLAHRVYGKTSEKITRAELVRGMIDAVLGAVDLSEAKSESDVRAKITAKFKR